MPSPAEAALAFARDRAGEKPEPHRFDLPGIRLSAHVLSPGFERALKTSLINDSRYAAGPQAQLTVSVADQLTHPDLPMPAPGGQGNNAAIGGAVRTATVFATYQPDFEQWQFFDPAENFGVQVMQRPDSYPPWEDSFPLVQFLHWATMAQGRRIIHAAALGFGRRGVLIAGSSGAGKSGTTLAGLLGGLDSIGDDYVLIDLAQGRVRAFPLTRIMKQDRDGLVRNGLSPEDARFIGPNWQGKYELYLEELMGHEIPESLDVAAIILPRIGGGASARLVPVSSREAMMALLPSNLLQLPGGRRFGVEFLAQLSRLLPAYRLELGTDPAAGAGVIGNLIEKARR
jgi:hypothetical protein